MEVSLPLLNIIWLNLRYWQCVFFSHGDNSLMEGRRGLILKSNMYVTLEGILSEIRFQHSEQSGIHCEDLRPPPQFLQPVLALLAWGTPVTYPSVWVTHLSMWSWCSGRCWEAIKWCHLRGISLWVVGKRVNHDLVPEGDCGTL